MTARPTAPRLRPPAFLPASVQAASASNSVVGLFFSLAGRAATTSTAMQHANNGHGMRRESAADQRNNMPGQATRPTTRTTREEDRSGHPRYGSRAAQTSFYGAGGRPRQQPQYSQFDDDYMDLTNMRHAYVSRHRGGSRISPSYEKSSRQFS